MTSFMTHQSKLIEISFSKLKTLFMRGFFFIVALQNLASLIIYSSLILFRLLFNDLNFYKLALMCNETRVLS